MLIKPTIILDMFLLLTHARINKIFFWTHTLYALILSKQNPSGFAPIPCSHWVI